MIYYWDGAFIARYDLHRMETPFPQFSRVELRCYLGKILADASGLWDDPKWSHHMKNVASKLLLTCTRVGSIMIINSCNPFKLESEENGPDITRIANIFPMTLTWDLDTEQVINKNVFMKRKCLHIIYSTEHTNSLIHPYATWASKDEDCQMQTAEQ